MEQEVDEDIKELAESYDLNLEEAEELQEFADEIGLDTDETYEIWSEM